MAERVRIAYICGSRYCGGAERYLQLLVGHIDRARFDPALLTFGGRGLDPLRAAVRDAGIPVVDVEYQSFASARGAARFGAQIAALHPDIVHLNLPGPFDCHYGLPALFARMRGVRHVVSTEHLPMIRPFAKAKLLRGLSARAIDRVITISYDNRIHLLRNHRVDPARIRVVYNGIPDPGPLSTCRGEPGRPRLSGVDILMVGALERRKGHALMLQALRSLPEEYRLTIAGAGPEEENIRALIQSAGLAARVALLGQRDDVAALIAASNLVAVPSYLEATPYVILEAMAAGRPVVASRIYGIPELVEDGVTGLLVEAGDAAGLARAVERLGRDPESAAAMGVAGRLRFKESFSIERSVAGTLEVYAELLAGAPGAQGEFPGSSGESRPSVEL